MKVLALTFDAAGNLPPMLGLAEALAARGHHVEIMGHASQAVRIAAAGAAFIAFDAAPERDGARDEMLTLGWTEGFDPAAAWDFLAQADRRRADILIVDSLLAASLAAANDSRWPTVALCHTPYEVMASFFGGRFGVGLRAADLTVVSSYAAFHAGPPVPANAAFAGPLRPRAEASSWSRRFPEKPLVLAGLSTGQQGQRPALERLCQALAMIDAEAVVTHGPAMNAAGLARGPLMSLERQVPHEAVLRDADLCVTHAGHGALAAALAAGVPMLCLPGGGDQPANADQVVALGLGERLDPAAPADEIAAAITRMLADRAMHDRARAFAAVIAAEPGPGPAIERIEAVAR